jgi:hypothetical protein
VDTLFLLPEEASFCRFSGYSWRLTVPRHDMPVRYPTGRSLCRISRTAAKAGQV